MVRHATKQASRSWCNTQAMGLHAAYKAVTALRTRPAKHGTLCIKASESQLFAQCRNASECCLQCIWLIQDVAMSKLLDAWPEGEAMHMFSAM